MTMGIHKDNLFVKQTQTTLRKRADTNHEGPLWTGRLVPSLAMMASEGAMTFQKVKTAEWSEDILIIQATDC